MRLLLTLSLLCPLAAPALAEDVVREPDTGTEFPARVHLDSRELAAVGVGLREATFMKVNVYAIASYIEAGTDLGEDPAATLITAPVARQFRIRFVRDIEGKKMREACEKGIEKNFGKDTADFAADLETFLSRLPDKFVSGDELILTYVPGKGVWGVHNGEATEAIDNPRLAEALWAIWLGKKPVSKGLKNRLAGLEE